MANIHWNENIRSNLNMNQGKVLEYHDVFPGQEHRDGWASFINSWICPFHVVLKLHLNLFVQTSQHVVQQNWFLQWKFPTHQGPQTQFQAKRASAVKRSSHDFAKIVGSTVMGKKQNNFGSGSEPSMTLLRWAGMNFPNTKSFRRPFFAFLGLVFRSEWNKHHIFRKKWAKGITKLFPCQ